MLIAKVIWVDLLSHQPNALYLMKQVFVAALAAVMLAGCVRHGCTDFDALNYSTSANVDDGSCIFPEDVGGILASNEVSVSWVFDNPSYLAAIDWSAITSSVVENGAVLVFAKYQNAWTALPMTVPWPGGYTSSINYFYATGGVVVEWLDSDFVQPDYPFLTEFRIVLLEDRVLESQILEQLDEIHASRD
jgi:hypothetical protein